MITCVTGMPGDGKTLFGMCHLVKRLIHTEKFMVTNMRVKVPELHAYVTKEREKIEKKEGLEMVPFDIDKRFKLIDDSDAFEFFRYRSGGLVLPHTPDYESREEEQSRRISKPQHDLRMLEIFAQMKGNPDFCVPCEFIIDEAHEIFPAREWTKGGRGILFYASKHRHLHDEITLITQQIDQVEKQLRNLVSETVVVRNQTRRNVGWFKAREGFETKFFYGLPQPNGKPFAAPRMEMDVKGPASCYKTTGALGVHDEPEKIINKGRLPYWSLYFVGAAAVVALVVGFLAMPALGALGAKRMIGATSGAVEEKMVRGVSREGLVEKGAARVARPVESEVVGERSMPASVQPGQKADTVTVNGYLVGSGGKVQVLLSDGRTLTEGDPALQRIDRNGVTVSGVKYFMKRPSAGGFPSKQPYAPADGASVADAGGVTGKVRISPATEPEAKSSPHDSRPVVKFN